MATPASNGGGLYLICPQVKNASLGRGHTGLKESLRYHTRLTLWLGEKYYPYERYQCHDSWSVPFAPSCAFRRRWDNWYAREWAFIWGTSPTWLACDGK